MSVMCRKVPLLKHTNSYKFFFFFEGVRWDARPRHYVALAFASAQVPLKSLNRALIDPERACIEPE